MLPLHFLDVEVAALRRQVSERARSHVLLMHQIETEPVVILHAFRKRLLFQVRLLRMREKIRGAIALDERADGDLGRFRFEHRRRPTDLARLDVYYTGQQPIILGVEFGRPFDTGLPAEAPPLESEIDGAVRVALDIFGSIIACQHHFSPFNISDHSSATVFSSSSPS